ncbi:prephenate dehydratase domain-containing protein [Buchnera aphidicola]|uniref:prephenate dehydratase domain-containing protein n=1 Tax=Buchnera aphidicola TaxID=9 RepID=UPI0034641758
MKKLQENTAKFAILPIKNNSSGNIKETNKLLKKSTFFIKDKIKIKVNHCIVSKKKNSLENIQFIYSHAEPIKQCQLFIKKFPLWNIKYTNSSSEAMRKISIKKKNNIAAIGNQESSKLYNLYIIKNNISDKKTNQTLFYIITKNN